MIERRCQLRFALEASPGRQVGQFGGQKLDRDGAIELGIRRAVYLAHPARADSGSNLYGPMRVPN